jgi:hypothetical protein
VEYFLKNKIIANNNPKYGDEVKFWLNPKNNIINIYFKGSIAGEGKIGQINSNVEVQKLRRDKLNGKIAKVTENSVFIKYY